MSRLDVRVSLVALCMLLAVGAFGCSGAPAKAVSPGEEVNLKVGQKFDLSLESDTSTQFSWRVRDDAGGCLRQVGEPRFQPASVYTGDVAGVGQITFTFEAVEAGTGTLLLEYGRPRERFAEPEKAVTVPVVVR